MMNVTWTAPGDKLVDQWSKLVLVSSPGKDPGKDPPYRFRLALPARYDESAVCYYTRRDTVIVLEGVVSSPLRCGNISAKNGESWMGNEYIKGFNSVK